MSARLSVTESELEEMIHRARSTGSLQALRRTLSAARDRVADAEKIGWHALRQSWARDVARAERALADITQNNSPETA